MGPEGSLPHSQEPLPPPVLSQIYPVHTPHPNSWRSIFILSSHLRPGFPSGLFPLGFSTKSLYKPFLYPIPVTSPTDLFPLDLITRTLMDEEYRSLSPSLCILRYSVTSSLLGQHILLNTLFSNTLSLRSSLNVSDQVPHPHKTSIK
jgi:hypothetical protein